MPIVAVGGALRPSGKSTTAVLLASAIAARGRRVLLVDADPKHAALEWRQRARGDSLPTAISAPVGDAAALLPLAQAFDLAVVDLPGAPGVADLFFAYADVGIVALEPEQAMRSPRGMKQPSVIWSRAKTTSLSAADANARSAGFEVLGAIPEDWRVARLLQDGLRAERRSLGDDVTHGLTVALNALAVLLPGFPALDDPTDVTDKTQPGQAARTVEQSDLAKADSEIDSFVRDMDTHVGNLSRSLLDMARVASTDQDFEQARALFQGSLGAARKLLGMHYQHGETFMVRDAAQFFEMTRFADRVVNRAERLVARASPRRDLGADAEAQALQRDLHRLVDDLRLLRG